MLPMLLALSAHAAEPETPEPPNPPVTAEAIDAGVEGFRVVYEVLTHPRCRNCHPDGDVPTVGDASTPHEMGIDRHSPERGLPCTTCHRWTGIPGAFIPPANLVWMQPPASQAFQDRTAAQLCAQLNNPENTGGRDLPALLLHVQHDLLVLWGWNPGGGRSTPPHSHAAFVKAFGAWVDAGGPCDGL